MALATKSQNKTGFVKKFLQNNPQANTRAVNEAWAAAGMKGMISHPIVSEMRKQLGLTGNKRVKTKTPAKTKPAPKAPKESSNPGKTMFVKEFLNDHPEGNLKAVNEAWRAAGFNGTISKTVLYKVKSSLGLTDDSTKSKSFATSKIRVTPRKVITPAADVRSNQTAILIELESDVDRLIFKAMAIGNLTEFEDMLRQARRLLYGVLTGS